MRWKAGRETGPNFSVSYHGALHVWVYGEPPKDPIPNGVEVDVQARLGDAIYLESEEVSGVDGVEAGHTLTVALYWQAETTIEGNYVVFTHLFSAEGELVAQHDSVPLSGIRPTNTWRPRELLEDVHHLALPENLEPGTYYLRTGMYDSETLQRLPAFDANGERLANGLLELGTVQVIAPLGEAP